jgi:tetratricopeptide (TPR) repeat protein
VFVINKHQTGAGRTGSILGIVSLGLLLAAMTGHALAQQPADKAWLGKRVVQKHSNFRLRNENLVIDPKAIETYLVEQVNGPSLRLRVERQGLGGWAQADQVIPVEEAIAFFTDYIRANPGDAHGYIMRAIIWRQEKKELDIALGDYNEAIRLDPTKAYVYTNRGTVWSARKEYDKAIADYNEASRLDPKDAITYNNRGNAWRAKKEYDKAIADYNEAIRIDPKYSVAYVNRGRAWHTKKEYDKAIADCNEAIRLDPKYAFAYFNRAISFFMTRRDGAVDGMKTVLELEGWVGSQSIYAVILGHLAARRNDQSGQAKAFLDNAAARCDFAAWPYPVVR